MFSSYDIPYTVRALLLTSDKGGVLKVLHEITLNEVVYAVKPIPVMWKVPARLPPGA